MDKETVEILANGLSITQIDGWNKWGVYVVKELERLDNSQDKMDLKLDATKNELITFIEANTRLLGEIKTEIAVLKLKAGIWGGLSGLLSAFLIIMALLKAGIIKFIS